MAPHIGFIGLGNMGQAMAGTLLTAGYPLRVYNRTPEKAGPLLAQGAEQMSHPGDVAEAGGIVITMPADDQAVEEVV
jgi:3-hydroxyisobutyrate dehydrogenase-like beta-hydroxyacid dehydrogenase